ncbi:uncharacterized protein LOC143915115 isoform X2 [Arctopsyche grandis]|uniref:uncharacterized protein LOC143915115 isoform X2 n=1 Tax=Arctopsyche grandis TaxID=121162 RepID=UPI00406D69A5
MPLLDKIQEEAPEKFVKNDNASSNASTSTTPITNSTVSSPNSFESASPETSTLFRIISASHENGFENSLAVERLSFPREQTLLDLLIQSSGVEDVHQLRQLREVRLRVVAAAVSLSRLEVYTPYVRVLRLDGSGLTSLREIGTTLNHLKVLHVSRCGLTNLDGTFGLSNLTELYAADNHIENVGPCAVLENIKVINLDRNPLNSIANVSLLSLCPHLEKLSIKGTPVSRMHDYKKIMKDYMPNLKKLDGDFTSEEDSFEESMGTDINDESYKSIEGNLKTDETASCSIEVSSLTEPSSEDNENHSSNSDCADDNQFVSNRTQRLASNGRPATALGISNSDYNARCHTAMRRPCTALPNNTRDVDSMNLPTFPEAMADTSPSSLTSGGIVCGNIARALSRARPPQKPLRPSSSKPLDPWIIGPPQKDDEEVPEKSTNPSQTKSAYTLRSVQVDDDSKNAHLQLLEEAKKFIDEPLPSKPIESAPVIDLELGIVGMVNSDPPVTQDADNKWIECSERALVVSRQWRRAFKVYRKQIRISGIKRTDGDN